MRNLYRLFILLFLLSSYNLRSQGTSSYSFFIAGHTYGKPGVNNIGLHPPFKQKFGYIKSRPEIKLGVLTGDIVSPQPDAQDWDEVDADIDSLGLPVYFAVGNHDMENRPLYESRYGSTYYHFIYENDLFIVLDPNIDHWNISGDQLAFMKGVVDSNYMLVDNIFVFFHQFLWWEKDNIYSHIKPNSFAGRADTINFWSEIEPCFHQLPNKVFFFAGDMGAGYWSNNFMYDSYDNLSYVCSGMGDGNGDNFVVINVDSLKSVSYDLICLNDTVLNCFGNLTDYIISSTSSVVKPEFVSFYPNPTHDMVSLRFDRRYADVSVSIFDLFGKLVLTRKYQNAFNEKINLIDLQKGLYFVTVTVNDLHQTMKLVLV